MPPELAPDGDVGPPAPPARRALVYNALPREASSDELDDVPVPGRRRRGWRHAALAAASLTALLSVASWRAASSGAVVGATGPPLPLPGRSADFRGSHSWQEAMEMESAFAVGVVWVGCFSADDSGNLDKGPGRHGFTTQTCATACLGSTFMALQENGKCVCGSRYAEHPQSQQVFDGDCGEVCPGEDALIPLRYCGTGSNNAIYRLVDFSAPAPTPAPTTTEAPAPGGGGADTGRGEETLVGTWLFGQERSKCFISRADGDGQLSFAVPLPRGQVAAGPLTQMQGGWFQAELSSNDNEDVGTIRIRPGHAPGTLISNFKYPGDAVWGKDTVAHKTDFTATEPTVPSPSPEAPQPSQPPATPGPAPEHSGPGQYMVIAPHGLYVRQTPSTMSAILGTRLAGIVVEGVPQGDWLRLTREPGFMLMRQHGVELMQRTDVADTTSTVATEAPTTTTVTVTTTTLTETSTTDTSTTTPGTTQTSTRTSTTSSTSTTLTTTQTTTSTVSTTTTLWGEERWATWKVVTPHGLNVRAGKSALSNVIATKPGGAKMLGKRFGEWLQLKDDLGFVMISNGNKNFLEPVMDSVAASDNFQAGPTDDAGPVSDLTQSQALKAALGRDVGIFCYALMMPSGYEIDLLKAQVKAAVGIFDCDDYAVFSNTSISLGSWNGSGIEVITSIVEGSLTVPFGGTWHTALNTGVFIRVWRAVFAHGGFRHYDWTVKADADCVFFPARLRDVLQLSPMDSVPLLQRDAAGECGKCRLKSQDTKETCAAHIQDLERRGFACEQALDMAARRPPADCGCVCGSSSCYDGARLGAMFVVNCRFGLHGPLELLSREAVNMFVEGIPKCENLRVNPWGEDKYLDHCLQQLGVRRVLKFDLLSEIACGQTSVECDAPAVAFHPFKDAAQYFGCMDKARAAQFVAK